MNLYRKTLVKSVFADIIKYRYGLVKVSTGTLKLEKRVARDASNSKLKIKR